MEEVFVFGRTGNVHRADLQQAIVTAKKSVVKVYRTHVHVEATSYVYTTTSKDVHLALGALGQDVHSQMALFLKDEFEKDGNDQLLLNLQQKPEERGESFLVTRSENKNGWVNYTLSPVH